MFSLIVATSTCLGDGGIVCLLLICDASFSGKFLDLIFIVGNMIKLFKGKLGAENTHGTAGVKKQSAGNYAFTKVNHLMCVKLFQLPLVLSGSYWELTHMLKNF